MALTLFRDRLDKKSSEVTYVSTDSVKLMGAVEFEVTYVSICDWCDVLWDWAVMEALGRWIWGRIGEERKGKRGRIRGMFVIFFICPVQLLDKRTQDKTGLPLIHSFIKNKPNDYMID
ncbi:Uncharacterized protein CEY00_Acc11613 [Actinidia chinensis var. chinensis]|uniref:Uncharacterized protein n=1 Tax=Actinidia chinensis var. chinensis TaxID=1590841 RepID=A0A2R6R2P6_ACTCC|nr:Uncharacterized protein CEY00_Acc11613 [Actinidia chinensis var. chinensis]